MRSWPSWLATFLGALALLLGIVLDLNGSVSSAASARWFALATPLLIGGFVLLAAGLHALQATYDSWCDCGSCMGSCGCCGDDCNCGDCGECSDGDGGEGGHGHAHGEGEHEHSH